MGIPRFGVWVENNVEDSVIEKIPGQTDILGIDGNGILHGARYKAFLEEFKDSRNKAEAQLYIDRMSYIATLSETQIWDLLLFETEKMITEVFLFFNPRRRFYLTIDGPAPRAKTAQQRDRREKTAMMAQSESAKYFNGSAITPGTNYMSYLNEFIKKMITKDVFKSCEMIIYSSHRVPGEGEHKILEYLRSDTTRYTGNTVLYGKDADLILLLLTTHQTKVYLSRESFTEFVSIDVIKAYLNKQVDPYNFIIIMFFIGNDFMKQFSMCRDMRSSIDRMVKIIVDRRLKLHRNGRINWNHMKIFLKEMSGSEPYVLQRESKYLLENKDSKRKLKRDIFLEASYTPNNNLFFDVYWQMYYDNECLPKNPSLDFLFEDYNLEEHRNEKVYKMCEEVVNGLEWYFLYYTQGTKAVNHDWFYSNYHAPLFSELSNFVETYINNFRFNFRANSNMKIFNMAEQLVAVIPKASMNVLPYELHKLYDIDSPLVDTYPAIVQLDMNGKMAEHEAIAYVPMIDTPKIIKAVQSLNLTNPELVVFENDIIIRNR